MDCTPQHRPCGSARTCLSRNLNPMRDSSAKNRLSRFTHLRRLLASHSMRYRSRSLRYTPQRVREKSKNDGDHAGGASSVLLRLHSSASPSTTTIQERHTDVVGTQSCCTAAHLSYCSTLQGAHVKAPVAE